MKQTITIRIDEKLKLDFIQICETQGRVPSKVIRGLLESYVSTNHDNNISGNVDTNDFYTIIGKAVIALTDLEITKINGEPFKSGGLKKTYKKGQPIRLVYTNGEYAFKEVL